MQIRKKKILDGIDREILRVLYSRRNQVSSQIAKSVGLSTSAIFPRLYNLESKGIIKISKKGGIRRFKKNSLKIDSPRKIFWDLDVNEHD